MWVLPAMKTKPKRRYRSWIRRRDAPRSNLQAAILTGLVLSLFVAMLTVLVVQDERFHRTRTRTNEWISLPWDPTWPALPVLSAGNLRIDVARAIYAFAGTKPEVLKYIPCYCGCRSQGHHSNHDCYVKRRSPDGRVTEWDSHGVTCPLGPDITGDVMLWHENGRPLSTIRHDIDQEFGSRGPATPTPKPPSRE